MSDPLSLDEREDVRDWLMTAAAALGRWQKRLQQVAARLPEPQYEGETDAPLNLSAAMIGTLEQLVEEQLPEAVESLRRAAAWIENPEEWRPRKDPPN